MIASRQVSSTTNVGTAEQERLVIVGATGMVGGYGLPLHAREPGCHKCDCDWAQGAGSPASRTPS
jgi:hypothetical protein